MSMRSLRVRLVYALTRQDRVELRLLYQSGKPAHEGSFHFASRFTGEKTISAKNYNDVYEGSCILSPSTNL